MNRKDLITHFFKSMDAMARIGAMRTKQTEMPKDMPSHAQMGVLFVILHRGPQTIKALSQQFGMTSSAATQLVNGLVVGKYLDRKEDKIDRRKICVVLTTKGKKVIAQAREHRIKKMMKVFEPLSDAELNQLLKIQTKIVEHWENHAEQK